MKKLYAAIIYAAVLSVFFQPHPMNAQKKDFSHLPYAFGHTLETSLGCSFSLNANGIAPGPEINLRYTYFWGKHFGVYARLGYSSHNKEISGVLKTLDKGRYSYEPKKTQAHYNESYTCLSAGLAYRLDFGKWSLRPRLGIGYGNYTQTSYGYYRYDLSDISGAPEFVSLKASLNDYSYTDPESNSIALDANIQMTYTLRNHFFLFAEIGGLLIPARLKAVEEVYATQKRMPSNWADAAIGIYGEEYEVMQITGRREISAPAIGGTISLRLGIGWNIGFNRNTKNRLNL